MDSILNHKIRDDDDFYKLLNCDELSNAEQINTEYKILARNLHPDKNPNNPKAAEEFAALQRARDVLMDDKKRTEYDYWRRSGLAIPYDTWLSMKESMHTSLHWAVMKKKEPMLEDDPDRVNPNTGVRAYHSNQEATSNTSNINNEEGQTAGFGWSRRPADETLQRFRNYQI